MACESTKADYVIEKMYRYSFLSPAAHLISALTQSVAL